ncbi:hypothetical protein B0H17DRAFT_1126636 [Mycena rosella]|uniref:F-box domain-containing protein n=1 Tax=Mycena rosella TaxID=1033263 RepID=A0AAD7GTI7_MYCRO|nr:hypothetical protein B0H17DRAFT_1126636 [Mycena rosella]
MQSTFSALSDKLTKNQNEITRFEDEHMQVNAKLDSELARLKGERVPLKAYYHDVRSALLPICHLPSEILVAIFALCAKPSKKLAKKQNFSSLYINTAQTHMATLAQPLCFKSPECAYTGMKSLWAPPPYTCPLELLARHSPRWKSIVLRCHENNLQHFSRIEGNLPLWETLLLEVDKGDTTSLDLFKVAPRLKMLAQLESFGCIAQDPTYIPKAVACMGRTHTSKFRLELDHSRFPADGGRNPDVPPTLSNITTPPKLFNVVTTWPRHQADTLYRAGHHVKFTRYLCLVRNGPIVSPSVAGPHV